MFIFLRVIYMTTVDEFNLNVTNQLRVDNITENTASAGITLIKNTFISDQTDTTKKARLDISTVTTGTTRVLSVPNATTTLVGTDVAQTLSNKSLVNDGSDDSLSGRKRKKKNTPLHG